MRALGSVELCFLRSVFTHLSKVLFLFRELAIERRVDEFRSMSSARISLSSTRYSPPLTVVSRHPKYCVASSSLQRILIVP